MLWFNVVHRKLKRSATMKNWYFFCQRLVGCYDQMYGCYVELCVKALPSSLQKS